MAKDCGEHYNEVCKGEFAELKNAITSVDDAIRGNGKEGLVTRIVKTELYNRLFVWVLSVQTAFILTIVGKLIYNHLSHVPVVQ